MVRDGRATKPPFLRWFAHGCPPSKWGAGKKCAPVRAKCVKKTPGFCLTEAPIAKHQFLQCFLRLRSANISFYGKRECSATTTLVLNKRNTGGCAPCRNHFSKHIGAVLPEAPATHPHSASILHSQLQPATASKGQNSCGPALWLGLLMPRLGSGCGQNKWDLAIYICTYIYI